MPDGKCWLAINKILGHSFPGNVYLNTQDINLQIYKYISMILSTSRDKDKKIHKEQCCHFKLNIISNGIIVVNIDGLVQERRNSSALAMELRLSCINPSIFCNEFDKNLLLKTLHFSLTQWKSSPMGQKLHKLNREVHQPHTRAIGVCAVSKEVPFQSPREGTSNLSSAISALVPDT